MSEMEFSLFVFDSNLLTCQEFAVMMKHYTGVLPVASIPFLQAPRDILKHSNRCYRFSKIVPNRRKANMWSYTSGKPDGINFSVNVPIKLYGVQHFGSEKGHY